MAISPPGEPQVEDLRLGAVLLFQDVDPLVMMILVTGSSGSLMLPMRRAPKGQASTQPVASLGDAVVAEVAFLRHVVDGMEERTP